MAKTAVIDASQVFVGMYEMDESIPDGAARLPQITDCDLRPHQYLWNGASFVPLKQGLLRSRPGEPDVMKAIYGALNAIRHGKKMPEETLLWLDWYSRTVDAVIKK